MERKTNEYDADAIGGRAGEDDEQYEEITPDDERSDETAESIGIANESDTGTE